jgi:hypothetical protein
MDKAHKSDQTIVFMETTEIIWKLKEPTPGALIIKAIWEKETIKKYSLTINIAENLTRTSYLLVREYCDSPKVNIKDNFLGERNTEKDSIYINQS